MKRFPGVPKCAGNGNLADSRRLEGKMSVLKRIGRLAVLWAASAAGATTALAANPYAEHTDVELTATAADWETLSEDDRRALLTEMRSRMALKKDAGKVIAIKTQRRYGRIVRKPDGSLVRIETTEHLVRFQRVPDGVSEAASDELPGTAGQAFGVGFEARRSEPNSGKVGERSGTPVSATSTAVPANP